MIQVDMFEVGLGSAMLLQFGTPSGAVRVLADAGVGHGFADDHAKQPIVDAITGFAGGTKRIDLMIGTHYDADHLKGLVPIIKDTSIAIGEAWLPPVANDATPRKRSSPRDRELLALQLADPETGDAVLAAYLRAQAAEIETARALHGEAMDEGDSKVFYKSSLFPRIRSLKASFTDSDLRLSEGYFEAALQETEERLGGSDGHVEEIDEDEDADTFDRRALTRFRKQGLITLGTTPQEAFLSLDLIVKSAAKKAITAKWLAEVVKALKARNIPIRCAITENGEPRRFIWNAAERRFEPNAQSPSAGPVLTLLGPSKALVAKHRDKLPIGDYLALASFKLGPPQPITESNQLSYVAVFEQDEQRLLVCGDAGFDDFKPQGRNQPFYPKLLASLVPLHIVEVAHHAGYNKHFYFGLIAAGYDKQTAPSFLLLSHAEDDPKRPNEQFGRFIELVRSPGRALSLLFTSQPREPLVRDFKALAAPVVGGAPAGRGDLQLVHDAQGWRVTRHAVRL